MRAERSDAELIRGAATDPGAFGELYERHVRAVFALPWLLGIAANVLRESARRNRLESSARERLGLPVDLAGDEGFAGVEARLSPRNDVARALARLPREQRRALELRVVDELPYREIARRLSIAPAAARLRVSRALRRLALAVEEKS